jgi:hypothetical protein
MGFEIGELGSGKEARLCEVVIYSFLLSFFSLFPRLNEEARAYSPSKGTMATHPGPPQSR